MFLIIWRGWGILVLPIAAVAFIAAMTLADFMMSLQVSRYIADPIGFTTVFAAAGAGIWFMAKALTGRNKRTLVDPATGQQFVYGSNAGSLFFIPTRFWAFIVLAVGIMVGLSMGLDNASATASDTAAIDSASQTSL